MKFKELKDQVIVITGATSGIGLVTARKAAQAGAKLVLAARDEESLHRLAEEIRSQDRDAIYVAADVGDEEAVRGIAQLARETFGGFDTWINNAGIGMYGLLTETPIEDSRRLFDTNFWGVVYGSLEAARYFRERGPDAEYGGVIINLGSVESDRVIPLQGMYATTKHAVKAFSEGLRMELAHEKVPVAVTLIKPSAIATPFPHHARNHMEKDSTLPPPLYAPETVAEAILNCAVAPQRDVIVGSGGKSFSILGQIFPGLGDRIVGSTAMFEGNKRDEPAYHRTDSLYQAGYGLHERGEFPGIPIAGSSPYTKVMQSPVAKIGLALAAGAAVFAWATRSSSKAS